MRVCGEIEGSSGRPTTSSSFLKPAETREEARLPYSRETTAAGRSQRTAQHRRGRYISENGDNGSALLNGGGT